MEQWQIEHIEKNRTELIQLTTINSTVKAQLLANNIISKIELDQLVAIENNHRLVDATFHCYQLFMRRTDAYKILTKALLENCQSGAARILIDGLSQHCNKPLEFCGISIELDRFSDVIIQVNGKRLKLHEFFPSVNIPTVQKIFQNTISELEIYDTFVKKEKTFVLAENRIPPKPPYYVSRFLSSRIKLDRSIFKAECTDVFVFKNTIARYKLSQIAKPHFTATSASQLTKITCRFVYLDENEDWSELKKISKVPIHLIKYETDRDIFLLEDTSDSSVVMRKLGPLIERVYLHEEDFVHQQLSEESTSSCVCICDSPGMGKTYLLANLARIMTERCAGRIIVFIQLTTFANDWYPDAPSNNLEPENALINTLSYCCPRYQNAELLIKLVKAKLLQVVVFLDGFDELPPHKVDWMKSVIRLIVTNFPNVKIYITSRPHMRQELEQCLGVLAYDILPFNQQNQVDFLVQFWQNNNPDFDQLSLQIYASNCLEAISKSLTQNDKEIAGIPLLCQLIAEVYSNKVAFRSLKAKRLLDVPLNISEMYQKFIENKINLVSKNKKEFDKVKFVHIWHALKLLFPTNHFHEENQFEITSDLLTNLMVLNAGILQKQSNEALEFIHRTFAEYLVAEYFSAKLLDKEMQTSEESNYGSVSNLKTLLSFQKPLRKYYFVHPVILSFFNSCIGRMDFSDNLTNHGTEFLVAISSEEFISILCACCQHNMFNIFLFLWETLKIWNSSQIANHLKVENIHELLTVCIRNANSKFFHACIQLVKDVRQLDVSRINTFDTHNTLLEIAVEYANYAVVEYFVDKVSLKNQTLLEKCVRYSNNTEKRENILLLLLNKDPTLIHEIPKILVNYQVGARLFKLLVKFGANLTAVDKYGDNCAMHAAEYLSPVDYHDIVQFLLKDRKAEKLFLENEKWKDPLPTIVKRAILLPETLELLFEIPWIDFNMKDTNGENLLFSAVRGNKLKTLQHLITHSIDYNKKGKHNRSLLHVAAIYGELEMVRYLLSLELDVNPLTRDKWTPLHYAVYYRRELPVIVTLVENGAKIQAKNYKGETPLHLHAARGDSTNTEALKYLIQMGAGVNDRDKDGNTPLHLCWMGEVVEMLVEMGADIHAKNNMGETPKQMNPRLWKSFHGNSETDVEIDYE